MIFRSKIQFFEIFVILLIVLFASSCMKLRNVSQDQDNLIFDLSKDFDTSCVYDFRGEWQFVWDTLLTPQEFENYQGTIYVVDVPSTWTKYKINGKNLPNIGYATYHTRFVVPHKGIYAFKFKRLFLSAKIFINDSLVAELGHVATNKKDYVASRLTPEILFYLDKDTNTITIQVANFSHKKAGILRSVKFGKLTPLRKYVYETVFYDSFITGSLAFMLFFFFVLYFYNKKVKSNLYFSLFLLPVLVIIIFDRELLFYRVFSHFSWAIATKLYYLAFVWRAYMFIILVDSLGVDIINKIFKKVFLWFSLIMTVFILVTPMQIYTHSLGLLILVTMLSLIYELIVVSSRIKKQRLFNFVFWGLLIIIVSGINDALYEYKIINTFYSSGIGIFIFTLLQSIEISIRNANILNTEEMLNNKFRIQNSLKLSLLNTPSYDLKKIMQSINRNLDIDQILLFTLEKDMLVLSIVSTKEDVKENINQVIDFNKTYDDFDVTFLKYTFDKKVPVSSDEFKRNHKGESSLILPLVENDRIIATVYFKNNNKKMSKALKEVLSSAQILFNSMIHTAVIYYNLEKMNIELDMKVQDRTKQVQEQKEELKEKNEQLDEKIQLLEEQYSIQTELNKAMESHNEEIQRENELLKEQNEYILQQNQKIDKHTKLIKSDITFANKILSVTLENDELSSFSEYFHLDLPKNIISGDFFFAKRKGNLCYLALADATGHGVPGALLRTFAYKTLSRLVEKSSKEKNISPAWILNELRASIKLNFSSDEKSLNEGLDIAFVIFDFNENKLYYSGAYNSLLFIKDGQMIEIKADRMPIGRYIENYEKSFTDKIYDLKKGDIFYLYTDGFADQFGGPKNEKYFSVNLRNLLLKISVQPFNFQKDILKNVFLEWKGDNMQIDDVSIVGLKI